MFRVSEERCKLKKVNEYCEFVFERWVGSFIGKL